MPQLITSNKVLLFGHITVFETNFLGWQPTGPAVSSFMFISKMLSPIRADTNVISSKCISPDEESN